MSGDFAALPGGGWHAWRGIVLRSAGLPVRRVEPLGDPRLAHAADTALKSAAQAGRAHPHAGDTTAYRAEFDAAAARLAAAVGDAARDPWFRAAVTWQNAELVDTCLDRAGGGRRDSRLRAREGAIASYLQRYATKNESIGFFGPVGWARWDPGTAALSVTPGRSVVGRRTVYFEFWAVDAVAAALAARDGLREAVPPRRVPALWYAGDHVVLPGGTRRPLTAEQAAVVRLCDGERPPARIAAGTGLDGERVRALVRELCEAGLLRTDLLGPIETHPERRLRARLAAIPGEPARRALADLDRLTHARDAVARAAGHPDRLTTALGSLRAEFEHLAGTPAVRARGRTYAARTVVVEDTVRDVSVDVGGAVRDALGPPLSLVLDSGRWLAARIGHDYLVRLDGYYERRRGRTGSDAVPLSALLALATRDFYTGAGLPAAAGAAVAELQRRWAGILAVPESGCRHTVAASDIADRVRREFASAPAQWSSGALHSPDVMIDAESVEAVAAGDFQLVLGELHLAYNTVESRALVEQSPDRAGMLAMAEAAVGGERVVPVAPRAWGLTTRTTPPPALLSPRYVYWSQSDDDVRDLPGAVLPVAALEVRRDGGRLVVRCLADGRTFPLAEVLGEYLSMVVVNAFRMLPRRRHTPRVSIDRLVVARESWSLPARRCDWAYQLDERERYLRMRAWVARHGMPRHAFFHVPTERKPMYVDFTSLPLTNNLARAVRHLDRDGADGDVTVSEMLPDHDGCWLTDARAERYTSELRMVVADHGR